MLRGAPRRAPPRREPRPSRASRRGGRRASRSRGRSRALRSTGRAARAGCRAPRRAGARADRWRAARGAGVGRPFGALFFELGAVESERVAERFDRAAVLRRVERGEGQELPTGVDEHREEILFCRLVEEDGVTLRQRRVDRAEVRGERLRARARPARVAVPEGAQRGPQLALGRAPPEPLVARAAVDVGSPRTPSAQRRASSKLARCPRRRARRRRTRARGAAARRRTGASRARGPGARPPRACARVASSRSPVRSTEAEEVADATEDAVGLRELVSAPRLHGDPVTRGAELDPALRHRLGHRPPRPPAGRGGSARTRACRGGSNPRRSRR